MLTESQNTAADDTGPSSLIQDDNPSIEPDPTASIGDKDVEADVDLDDTEDSAGATEMSPTVNTCPCNCLCCQIFEIPQPTAAELKSHVGRLGPSKLVGMLSIHGSVYALHPTISYATFAAMEKNKNKT